MSKEELDNNSNNIENKYNEVETKKKLKMNTQNFILTYFGQMLCLFKM